MKNLAVNWWMITQLGSIFRYSVVHVGSWGMPGVITDDLETF